MEEYLQYDEIKTVHSKVEIPSLWIVIPFYNELVALKAHLEVLEKQTKKDFFVVVVASNICESKEVLDTVKRFSLQIAILKRKNDTGSAGAFALGTTYALNHNCDAVIFADVDALPFENDLVENIYFEFLSGNELILPKVRQIVDDKSVGVDYSINIYGLLSARIIRIIGVHYVPAYLGGEDMELVQRAESLVKKKLINKSVSHPIMQFGSRNLERSTVYVTNLALLTIPKNFPYYFFLSVFALPIMAIFGSSEIRSISFNMLRCLFFGLIGKSAYPNKLASNSKTSKYIETDYDLVISPAPMLDSRACITYPYSSKQISKASSTIRLFGSMLNKRILLFKVNFVTFVMSLLFSKKCAIQKTHGNLVIISESQHVFLKFMKFVFFLLFFPTYVFFALIFFAVNVLRRPKTFGYGLGDIKKQ